MVLHKQYDSIVAAAKHAQIVREGGHCREAFFARNRWMVDRCERLTAMWNGEPSGTGYTVGYAEPVGRPWDNLWAEYQARIPA